MSSSFPGISSTLPTQSNSSNRSTVFSSRSGVTSTLSGAVASVPRRTTPVSTVPPRASVSTSIARPSPSSSTNRASGGSSVSSVTRDLIDLTVDLPPQRKSNVTTAQRGLTGSSAASAVLNRVASTTTASNSVMRPSVERSASLPLGPGPDGECCICFENQVSIPSRRRMIKCTKVR